jgi:hypothetical protein
MYDVRRETRAGKSFLGLELRSGQPCYALRERCSVALNTWQGVVPCGCCNLVGLVLEVVRILVIIDEDGAGCSGWSEDGEDDVAKKHRST